MPFWDIDDSGETGLPEACATRGVVTHGCMKPASLAQSGRRTYDLPKEGEFYVPSTRPIGQWSRQSARVADCGDIDRVAAWQLLATRPASR